MPTGVVARFSGEKGWGFIKSDSGGPDVMVHIKELVNGLDPVELKQGVRVSYDERSGPKGLRAINVCVLEDISGPSGYVDVLTAVQFRDEVSTILADAVSRLEEFARRHGWIG